MSKYKYCHSLEKYVRYPSRKVDIGNIPLGENFPIRIQSMTTTNTLDVNATVNQAKKIFDVGGDYVRITAPSIKEARILKDIKRKLVRDGYNKPLIADIHFTPNAAIEAANIVEKIRINPGNYADRKSFKVFEIDDRQYNEELYRIHERFSPLVKICKENGTAMRIGTNHGSLSDRIMNRYGDTPLGMVESAMEFIRICEDHSFFNIVLSMKSSNPIIMIQAYRLLVNKMIDENMNYPLHLGVTEAGEGIQGRIKSSIGIGALLEDGLGDTIRVSLTEEPEHEIPIAQRILRRYKNRSDHDSINNSCKINIDPFSYNKRDTYKINNFGGDNVPRVIVDLSQSGIKSEDILSELGYSYFENHDKWLLKDLAVDYIYLGTNIIDCNYPEQLGIIYDYSIWKTIKQKNNIYPKFSINEYSLFIKDQSCLLNCLKFIYIDCNDDINEYMNILINDKELVLLVNTYNKHALADQRNLFFNLNKNNCKNPVIICRTYNDLDLCQLQVDASIDIGGLLVDGLGDGLLIVTDRNMSIQDVNKLSFEILQSTRMRITKTDFISCPSCGRTQFDLLETTALVRSKTSHLKGLKIAIMGCIVNGPGEMADADYGYVGTGFKKISLYKGHEVIKKNINSDKALDELIDIIKSNDDWIEVE